MVEGRPNQSFTRITEGTLRLVAFSDGVFGIAMTLLVINIHIPQTSFPGDLLYKFLDQWPQYMVFALTFFRLGILWANHHEMFRFIRRSNHYFLMINIVFLMVVAFIPFPTAMLAEYLLARHDQGIATVIYNAAMIAESALYNAIWLYSIKNGLVDKQCDPTVVRSMTREYLIAPIAFSGAFLLAFRWYPVSLVLDFLVSLLYLIPSSNRPIYPRRIASLPES